MLYPCTSNSEPKHLHLVQCNVHHFGMTCSSVLRAFAHDAMGRGGPIELFLVPASSPVCEMMHIKEPLLLIG